MPGTLWNILICLSPAVKMCWPSAENRTLVRGWEWIPSIFPRHSPLATLEIKPINAFLRKFNCLFIPEHHNRFILENRHHFTIRRDGDIAWFAAVKILIAATDDHWGVLTLGVLDVCVEHLPGPVLRHSRHPARVGREGEAVDAAGVTRQVVRSRHFLKVSTPTEFHLPDLKERNVSQDLCSVETAVLLWLPSRQK